MRFLGKLFSKDFIFNFSILFLLIFSVLVLNSLDKTIFPQYFIYILFSVVIFSIFSSIGFDIIALFSKPLYIGSVVLLIVTLILGSVTRNTVRWIQLGPGSFQPAEIVRPFLLVFFAGYLGQGKVDFKKIVKALLLLSVPVFLILIQPSLGVSVLTIIGFVGVLLASKFNKKYLLIGVLLCIVAIPVVWHFMAPYQKLRITTFLAPTKDPRGAGYNSIQATIAAGSGKFFGTGLGKGVQTQLAFLPEKQTDFIFAATAEELGFVGVGLLLIASFGILFKAAYFMEHATSPAARAYLSGFILTYLSQLFVHAGMNMGILPITGIPFPLFSAGGSSLLATMMALGITIGSYKKV